MSKDREFKMTLQDRLKKSAGGRNLFTRDPKTGTMERVIRNDGSVVLPQPRRANLALAARVAT